MRAELPQSGRDISLLAPATALLALARPPEATAIIDLVPDAPLFAPLSPATGRSLSPETLAGDMRPADFGPMLALGSTASATAPDLVSLALAVLLHASACLGLLQFSMGGARVDAGYDEEPIEVVMDTAAGASVVQPESSTLDAPAPAAEAVAAKKTKAEKPAPPTPTTTVITIGEYDQEIDLATFTPWFNALVESCGGDGYKLTQQIKLKLGIAA